MHHLPNSGMGSYHPLPPDGTEDAQGAAGGSGRAQGCSLLEPGSVDTRDDGNGPGEGKDTPLSHKQVGVKAEARRETRACLLLKNISRSPSSLRGFLGARCQLLLMSSPVQKVVGAFLHHNLPPNVGQLGNLLQREEELPKGHFAAFGREFFRDPPAKQFWPREIPPRTVVMFSRRHSKLFCLSQAWNSLAPGRG